MGLVRLMGVVSSSMAASSAHSCGIGFLNQTNEFHNYVGNHSGPYITLQQSFRRESLSEC